MSNPGYFILPNQNYFIITEAYCQEFFAWESYLKRALGKELHDVIT